MKLIIVLLGLGLERFFSMGSILYRFNWFDRYVQMLKSISKSNALWKSYIGVIWVVAPILVVVAIVYLLLADLIFGTMGLAVGFLIFLYCLGPEDLHQQAQRYIMSQEQNDTTAAKAVAEQLVAGSVSDNDGQRNRSVSEAMLLQSNERILAVLFWFCVLGPLGAVLYRVSSLWRHKVEAEADAYDASLVKMSVFWQEILDWLPTRISALLFGLAGNFPACFSKWMRLLFSGPQRNHEILVSCGLAALGMQSDTATIDENRAVLSSIDRVLVIVLVLLAVFTLGALFY